MLIKAKKKKPLLVISGSWTLSGEGLGKLKDRANALNTEHRKVYVQAVPLPTKGSLVTKDVKKLCWDFGKLLSVRVHDTDTQLKILGILVELMVI